MFGRTHSLIRATTLLCLFLLVAAALFVFAFYTNTTNASAASAASTTSSNPSKPYVPSVLPPIPAGMPTYFDFGLFSGSTDDIPASIAWDFRYQYLSGGANTGDGWATWNPNGGYATNYINDSRDRGLIPAFQYYQILQSAPNYDEYANMQVASTMYSYFDDWKLLMTKCGQAGGTVVVSLEADLTGVMQQLSTNDDATTVSASVASSGHPDAAGYANNFKGMYQAMLHIRDLYAPQTLVALDVSNWGADDDIVLALRNDPNYNWQHHADRTAAFLNSLGPGFDMLSWNPSDRDSAWYQSQGSNRWWDELNVTQPTFNTMGAWIGRIVQDTNKRVVLWQVPNGNKVYRSENNTDGHWQDNRTDYFLNPTNGRQHILEWCNLGVLGIWWGAGVGSQTHYYDSKGDGITNPAPINGNNEVALYADDDGGYIRVRSDAYYSQGVVYLPGSTQPSPTRTATGTPPTATRTPTRTNTSVVPPTATSNPGATSVVYAEGLQNGWQNWSWGSSVTLQDGSYHHTGQYSLSCAYTQAWGGLQIGADDPGFNTAGYNYLLFYINGGASSGQQIDVNVVDGGGTSQPSVALDDYIVGGGGVGQNAWKLVRLPLVDLHASNIHVTAIALQDSMGGSQPRFYVDDMLFSGSAGGPPTAAPTSTKTPTGTWVPPTNTNTPTGTWVPPTATTAPCTISFTDVNITDYFYEPVLYLYCRGVVGGYADNTFRPYNTTTRAQLAKMVVLAETWAPYTPPTSTFKDVPPGSTFYQYVETAAQHDLISGYSCGGPSEPCDGQSRPYFRPNSNVSRAQVAKIMTLAENWTLLNPGDNTFADILPGSTFYRYIETAFQRELISGYLCGGSLEPCDGRGRPYFRPNNSATRGQAAKMIYFAVTGP